MLDEKPHRRDDDDASERSPGQARDLGEPGRKLWPKLSDETRERARKAGYVAAVVVNAIVLAIAHDLPTWRVPFITPAFGDVLWAMDLSLGATIVANSVFFAFDPAWFRNLVQIVLNALALVAGIALYRVFPFDFGNQFANDLIRLAALGVVVALAIAIVVETVSLLVDQTKHALSD
jgi:hypothetical protein